jgi:potassium-transporting ATPase KdpC subunit
MLCVDQNAWFLGSLMGVKNHLRANCWLLFLTLFVCSVVYAGGVWAIAQTLFSDKAQGSLVDKNGQSARSDKGAVGSRLFAQSCLDGDGNVMEEYFQPRPSAASYDGTASGATNWGPSNPALRKRVMAMLGPNLKYSNGRPIGPDIVHWVRERLQHDRAVLAQWVKDDTGLPERWASIKTIADFLAQWANDHPDDVARWHRDHADADKPKPADLAALFFDSYAKGESTVWPATHGYDIQTAFFEIWWHAHPQAHFEAVPADMVMSSGSGLDPHITLENAVYQLDRVAGKWAEKLNAPREQMAREIRALVETKKEAPLGRLAGVELINVLELNVALTARMHVLAPH